MNKSTLALVVVATLILGALIGISVVGPRDATNTTLLPAGDSSNTVVDASAPVIRFLAPEGVEIQYDDFGSALPFVSGDNYIDGTRPWQQERLAIEIEGDGSVEYKALMNQGDSLSFHWSVDDGAAYYDMHAHDAAFGEEFFTRYDEGEGTNAAGTIIAPYKGEHGWFWLNLEEDPITITLEVAGFYDEIVKIDLDAEM